MAVIGAYYLVGLMEMSTDIWMSKCLASQKMQSMANYFV